MTIIYYIALRAFKVVIHKYRQKMREAKWCGDRRTGMDKIGLDGNDFAHEGGSRYTAKAAELRKAKCHNSTFILSLEWREEAQEVA